MKKYFSALLVFGCFTVFFFLSREETTVSKSSNEESKSTINKSESSSNKNNSLASYSSVSSITLTFSSNASSSSSVVSEKNKPWTAVMPSQETQNKVDNVIGAFSTPVTRAFIKVDLDFLAQIEVDGIYEIPIPDAADADMHVVNIEKKDGLTNVVGHLSGYPESYYIGFSYDKEGHIYGEITTEKSNYSIKTYYGQPVVVKVVPEMEKTQRDDF